MLPAMLNSGSLPPWVGLAAAVWVQVVVACAYTFPLYSHTLKSVLGYNQQQLTMLGVANDAGESFGLLAGFVCNTSPPWVVLLIGAAFCFTGYGAIWLAVSQTAVGLPYWLLWIAQFVATNSCAWFGTGVLVTNMKNFPFSRGTVAGILKGYVGISASVYSALYSGLLHSSSSNLLLFLTLGLPAISLMMIYFIRVCTPSSKEDPSEQSHLIFIQITCIILGVYILIFRILDDKLSLGKNITIAMFSFMIILLMAPLAIPLKITLITAAQKTTETNIDVAVSSSERLLPAEVSDKTEPLIVSPSENSSGILSDSETKMLLAVGEGAVKKKRRPRRGDDFEFFEAMVKADFWLLFVIFFLGIGSGVTVLNNLAQIGIAAGINDTTILLCIFSFCNFLGRLGGGTISEHFCKTRMFPRSIWMTFAQITMLVAHLLYGSAIKGLIYVSTAMLGLCYGVQYTVTVPTLTELFGLKQFALLYNFVLLGNPLGALVFSGLAGYLYDKEAAKQHSGSLVDSSTTCFGPSCFRLTFMVLAVACCIGTLLSVILTLRIRSVYQMLYSSGSFKHPRSNQQLS